MCICLILCYASQRQNRSFLVIDFLSNIESVHKCDVIGGIFFKL